MEPVLHIISSEDWSQAQVIGVYHPSGLDTEGFIHCSTQEQLIATANRYYRGRSDLAVLVIDPERLVPALRWERSRDELYPHIYGPLNLDAVVALQRLVRGAGGEFTETGQVSNECQIVEKQADDVE